MAHRARKRFGQNFLQDPHVIARMIRDIRPTPDGRYIEIGPGLGALTLPLLHETKALTAIELDRDLIPFLRAKAEPIGTLNIINQDVLETDWTEILPPPATIVGNLPYNISTPLMLSLLPHAHAIKAMHFLLQKEVVERLAATPNTKAYGRLSVMMQAVCAITPLQIVPKEAFTPAPKVTSMTVQLIPKANIPHPNTLAQLAKITQLAFSQRRKQLKNTLGKSLPEPTLSAQGIDLNLRPENLSVDTYLALAKATCAPITAPE